MSPTIKTYTGSYFNFLEPESSLICIEDIAHALSNTCRFGGHCSEFYSVAQHAVLVSYLVPVELAWQGLHHDDAEAYIGDIPTPLKRLLPDFRAIEKKIEHEISKIFGLPEYLHPSVKIADLQALMLEREVLIKKDDGILWECFEGISVPTPRNIIPLKPKDAEKLFFDRVTELSKFKYKISQQPVQNMSTSMA